MRGHARVSSGASKGPVRPAAVRPVVAPRVASPPPDRQAGAPRSPQVLPGEIARLDLRSTRLPVGVLAVVGRGEGDNPVRVVDLVEDSRGADPNAPGGRVPVFQAGRRRDLSRIDPKYGIHALGERVPDPPRCGGSEAVEIALKGRGLEEAILRQIGLDASPPPGGRASVA